ncbi:MAG: TIGR02186 family protein [Micavibrio sp.]
MMMKKLVLLLVMICLPLMLMNGVAQAQTSVTNRNLAIDLALDHVDINLGFNGANISLFGVKNQPGDVAVVIRGPELVTVVRRKDKKFGIWMNTHAVEFFNVPVYYDFAASKPELDIAPIELLRKYHIGLDALDIRVEKNEDPETVDAFKEALVRNRQSGGHFPLSRKPVIFVSDDFFRVDFHVPADVPTGSYLVEVMLFSNGKLVERRETNLRVAQVGFSASVYKFANNNGLIYGLFAVFMAMALGAGAHLLFWRSA